MSKQFRAGHRNPVTTRLIGAITKVINAEALVTWLAVKVNNNNGLMDCRNKEVHW